MGKKKEVNEYRLKKGVRKDVVMGKHSSRVSMFNLLGRAPVHVGGAFT